MGGLLLFYTHYICVCIYIGIGRESRAYTYILYIYIVYIYILIYSIYIQYIYRYIVYIQYIYYIIYIYICTWFDTAGPSTATSALPCATSAVLHGMGDKCARGAIFRDVVLEGVSIVTVPKIAGWCSSWTMEEVTPMGNLQIMRDIIESDTRCGLATRDVVQHGRLVN